ncbi:MAG: hypothetical protein IJP92_11150 [Lachnospiraceae bacterium]|nr:hypothetical protein [Lachnospiraceae bacterium]
MKKTMMMLLMATLCLATVSGCTKKQSYGTGREETDMTSAAKEVLVPERQAPVYPTGPAGFLTRENDRSFAARAEGVYLLGNGSDGAEPEYLELYNIGGNLYGLYSGADCVGLEFFPAEGYDFADEQADAMPVQIMTFASWPVEADYWSNGKPALLTLSIGDGNATFSDAASTVTTMVLDGETYVRQETDMGHTPYYAYASDDLAQTLQSTGAFLSDAPEELYGLWHVSGDADNESFIEFTPEGLVEIYQKDEGWPVMLYRGRYAVAYQDGQETPLVYLSLMGFGYTEEPRQFCLSYETDAEGHLVCLASEELFGYDLYPEGAIMTRADLSDIRRVTSADAFGANAAPAVLTGNESERQFRSWLDGTWELCAGGDASPGMPYATLTFNGTEGLCTFTRSSDGATAEGFFGIKRDTEMPDILWMEFENIHENFNAGNAAADGIGILMHLYVAITDDGLQLMYMHEIEEDDEYGQEIVVGEMLGKDQRTKGGGWVFRKTHEDAARIADMPVQEELSDSSFCGLVWQQKGTDVYVQRLHEYRFVYEDEEGSTLPGMSLTHTDPLRTFRLTLTGTGENDTHGETYECVFYHFLTDSKGEITEMTPLTEITVTTERMFRQITDTASLPGEYSLFACDTGNAGFDDYLGDDVLFEFSEGKVTCTTGGTIYTAVPEMEGGVMFFTLNGADGRKETFTVEGTDDETNTLILRCQFVYPDNRTESALWYLAKL